MTASNLQASFDATMVWEGGAAIVNDPRDPGGVTAWGVSAAVARAHGLSPGQVTKGQALAIFKSGYWDNCACNNLPVGLDHCVSDDAFNAGPGNALRLIGMTEGVDPVSRIKSFSGLGL